METTTFVLLCCSIFIRIGLAVGISADSKLDFLQLAKKYGHAAVEYQVITEDGYILKLFHMPGKIGRPVLLMHGISDSSDTWIIRGKTSLAITLANRGHDVWLGNCRGNRYSRQHTNLNPDANDSFWDFTFNEIGYYDLPAIIDTVLHLTKEDKLNAIGHSQGNTIFYVLGSTRPEYNEKINVLIALSPICFMQNIPPPMGAVIEISPTLDQLGNFFNVQEIFGENSAMSIIWKTLCPIPKIGYQVCINNFFFPFLGYDEEELEAKFMPTLVAHFPTGTSKKSLIHFAQVSLRNQFAPYDYGTEVNLQMYNSSAPTEYDLSAVKMKVALIFAANDKLSTLDNIAKLKEKLPNVIDYILIPRLKVNHADFVMGRNMGDYLFPYIFDVLIHAEDKK